MGGGLLNKHNSPKLHKFKENNNKRKIIAITIIFSILALSSIYLYNSFAVFSEEKHFNVINGEVTDPGDIYFAYYVDGEITRNMPKQNTGYKLDTDKSNCTNGVKVDWNYAVWHADIDYSGCNATDYTRTRCNLYFVKESTVSTALGDLTINSYTPDFTKSACDDSTCESHEKGVFAAEDDDGTSYYYRGSVENNYVKFAGYYWRIIRINGNGSVRMIYDGDAVYDNGEASPSRSIGSSKFNQKENDNRVLGYMYESNNQHGLKISSIAKGNIDTFYKGNLTSYANYIDANSGFCGDREVLNGVDGAGTGSTITFYKAFARMLEKKPSLKCSNSSDYYTISSASTGNKALTYPIALITADEAMLGGLTSSIYLSTNETIKAPDNYLSIKVIYVTMTPIGVYNSIEYNGEKYNYYSQYIAGIGNAGHLWDWGANNDFGLRPVINLKSTSKFTGDGTKNNPYLPSL